MTDSLEFLLGLLAITEPAHASFCDFLGPHALALSVFQRLGFLSPHAHPHGVPSCPYCFLDRPVMVGGQLCCPNCLSIIDARHLNIWRFDLDHLLDWLAMEVTGQASVRRVDESLWQLGASIIAGRRYECFFCRSTNLITQATSRLTAYRSAILLQPLPGDHVEGFEGIELTLLELLELGTTDLRTRPLSMLMQKQSDVQFRRANGSLWVGTEWLGDVPTGTREYYFLSCLADQLDDYVAYADLKYHVLLKSGGRDTTDEATFCQKLKSRIKRKWIAQIDRAIVSSNKGDGYRLRGTGGVS